MSEPENTAEKASEQPNRHRELVQDFAVQAVANAAGTLLAAGMLFLIARAVGLLEQISLGTVLQVLAGVAIGLTVLTLMQLLLGSPSERRERRIRRKVKRHGFDSLTDEERTYLGRRVGVRMIKKHLSKRNLQD